MKMWLLLLACSGCESFFPLNGPPPKLEYVTSNSDKTRLVKTLDVELPRPALDGDLLVVAVAVFHVETLTVSDSSNNTFTEPNATISSPGGSGLHVLVAKNIPAADPLVITAEVVTPDPTPEITMAVHLYRGADPDDPVDLSVSEVTDVDSPDIRCGKVETTEDGELYFATLAHDGSVETTPNAGFIEREVPTDNAFDETPLYTADMIAPAQMLTGPIFTLTPAESGACQLLSFRPSAMQR